MTTSSDSGPESESSASSGEETDNLLPNPSFETVEAGNVPSWRFGDDTLITIVETSVFDGTYALELVAPYPTVFQDLDIEMPVDGRLAFRGWVRAIDDMSTAPSFHLDVFDGNFTAAEPVTSWTDDGTWVQGAVTLDLPQGLHSVRVMVTAGAQDLVTSFAVDSLVLVVE